MSGQITEVAGHTFVVSLNTLSQQQRHCTFVSDGTTLNTLSQQQRHYTYVSDGTTLNTLSQQKRHYTFVSDGTNADEKSSLNVEFRKI